MKSIDHNALKLLIEDFHAENLIGLFSDKDSEFVKEIIRDFVENHLCNTPEIFKN